MRFAQASAPMGRTVPGHARPRHVLSLVIAALTIIPLAVGCQAASSSTGLPTQQTPITVAAIKGVDNAPLYLAQRDGAFSRAGLDVTIRPYASVGLELRALSKGSVNIAAGDYVDFFSLVWPSKRP